MQIKTSKLPLEKIKTEVEILFILQNKLSHRWVSAHKKELTMISDEVKQNKTILLGDKLFVGIDEIDSDHITEAVSKAIKYISSTNFKTIKIGTIKNHTKSIVEGLLLGCYSFTKYKTNNKEKKRVLTISQEEYSDSNIDFEVFENDVKEAIIISEATNLARELINTSPEDVVPKTMSEHSTKVAKENKINIEILGEKELKKEGMNCFLAVSRASVHEAQLIHLSYKPKKAKKKVVIVGKGLTYDCGGLSLKPSNFMETMKSDKSGACTALGITDAISKLGVDVEVHTFLGCCENMIGGNAYKPDDIYVARNKKSVEIRNTDAEGRLVLVDVLDYAQDKVKDADYIFDLATLTGACVVALGEYTVGLMGNNKSLISKIEKVAEKNGEFMAYLPFNRHLRKKLDSKIADICHISNGRYGGAITAGLFLDEFIKKENKNKWVHFDIAGPAYLESAFAHSSYGATGASVKTIVDFIKNI